MKEKRGMEIAVLTAFFCVCVIMIHLTALPVSKLAEGSWQRAVFYFTNKSLSFVVPGFVFLSGLKLTLACKDKPFVFGAFFRKRLWKLVPAYAFWYVVFYHYFVEHGFMAVKTPWEHIKSFFLGTMVSPFYFITIIFQFYLLYWFFHMAFCRISHRALLGGAFALQILFLAISSFPYDDRFFGTYLGYFVLGMFFANHKEECLEWVQKRGAWIGAAFGVLTARYVTLAYHAELYGSGFPYARVMTFFFSVSAILFFYLLAAFAARYLKGKLAWLFLQIQNASYYIYLSHCYVIYLCNDQWFIWGKTSIVGRFLYTARVLFPTVFFLAVGYVLLKQGIFWLVQKRKKQKQE